MEVGEGPKNDVPGFLTALGGPFRWRAVLPSGTSIPADTAPNARSILFSLPDQDSDGLPDSADPCPAEPFSALNAPGWSPDDRRDGCPAPAVPFAARKFKTQAKKAARAFRALWRNHRRRAKAMSRRRIDVRLRLPGTRRGMVEAAVVLAHPDAPRPPSAFGRHRCTGGKACVVHMKRQRGSARVPPQGAASRPLVRRREAAEHELRRAAPDAALTPL
jgi:hypothetical protein